MQRGFEQQWLSITFSKAVFLGNGLVAILSGLFGNLLVDSFSLGPVAPFDAAACFLAIGMAIILSSWTENYGDPSESKDLLTQFRGAAVAIASGKSLIYTSDCTSIVGAFDWRDNLSWCLTLLVACSWFTYMVLLSFSFSD